MAINPLMMSALKALSYADIEVSKLYKSERALDAITSAGQRIKCRLWDHIVLREDYPIPVRLFEPKKLRSDGLIVFFHGGGWVTGTIDSYSKTCTLMANQTGRQVASVDYRLAPEHPFPCGAEDCYHVLQELYAAREMIGIGEEGITLAGDSAGGNIAAAVSLMARDRGEFVPPRQILIYPATGNDHTPDSPYRSVEENGYDYLLTAKRVREYIDLYIQKPEDRLNPYFSPLLAEDLSGQPDTLIITAEFDPLRDEGEAYGEKLCAFGNRVEIRRMGDALHGFFMLPIRYAHVKRAYQWINEFLSNTY